LHCNERLLEDVGHLCVDCGQAGFVDGTGLQVVLQVLSDPLEFVDHFDAVRLEVIRVADA